MKEKLTSALGSFGLVLFYVFTIIYAYAPLFILDFPFWVDILIILFISISRAFGGILCLGLYIWALVIVLTHPIDIVSIIFLVCAILYFSTSTLPLILLFFKKGNDQ